AAAPASAAGRASECDARPALPEHPLELAPVSVASVVVERARVRVTDLFEQVLHPVDRVGVVAVELLRLVALGGVVGVEALLRLGDLVGVFALEEVELPLDHVAETAAPEHHASSRYSSRCAAAAAPHVSSARARSAPARAGPGSASTSRTASVSAWTSPAGTTRPAP